MNFFTPVNIPAAPFEIDYTKKIFFVGSCFAHNISARFAEKKFQILANPFGTLYNPLSIQHLIRNIAQNKTYTEADIFLDGRSKNCYHCWDAHGDLSHKSKERCIDNLNQAIINSRKYLKNADVAFITLGSAFVYFLKENNAPVANCHRQSEQLFSRRLISFENASLALSNIIQDLHSINSEINIVFTVSPLRHLSDGAHGNNLSKATLHLAIDKAINDYTQNKDAEKKTDKDHSNENKEEYRPIHSAGSAFAPSVSYFPSYEIVMDELRDYRFYDSDMIHLSKTAEDYIFQRMTETYCSETTRNHIHLVEKFLKNINHKILDRASIQSALFQEKCRSQAEALEQQIPGLKF